MQKIIIVLIINFSLFFNSSLLFNLSQISLDWTINPTELECSIIYSNSTEGELIPLTAFMAPKRIKPWSTASHLGEFSDITVTTSPFSNP